MTASYIPPTSGTPVYPDIQPGQLTQTNGNPALPGTSFEGPLLAGSVQVSDGTNNLAGVGGTTGTANRGWVQMAQSCVVTQATNTGTAGQFACPIVIPAQSQILHMTLMVTVAWSGASANLGVGSNVSATAFTAANAVTGSGTLGQATIVPGTSLANQIVNWDNVGTSDVQIVILSANTGTGVGTFTVEYIQGIDLAS
jgi:hypothetical protein